MALRRHIWASLGQDVSRAMQGSGIPAGVYVTEAVSGSPAYDAGIQPGDIIVKFGTKEIGSFKDPRRRLKIPRAACLYR